LELDVVVGGLLCVQQTLCKDVRAELDWRLKLSLSRHATAVAAAAADVSS